MSIKSTDPVSFDMFLLLSCSIMLFKHMQRHLRRDKLFVSQVSGSDKLFHKIKYYICFAVFYMLGCTTGTYIPKMAFNLLN